MKKLLVAFLLIGLLLPLAAQNERPRRPPRGPRSRPARVQQPLPKQLLLNEGAPIPLTDILGKDQYGVMVAAGTDPETGDKLRRFIPFVAMNPASLALFPFCDTKAVERTNGAVLDRLQLIRKKFQTRIETYEKFTDFSAELNLHSGVARYKVVFTATEANATGLVGYIYSDTADTLFYGKIYLYGLIGNKDSYWIGTMYPTDRKQTVNGKVYPVFTVIPPPAKAFGVDAEMDKDENADSFAG